MTDRIRKQAREIQKRLVEWRRHFHQRPEIGLEVPETAGFVIQELTKLGLEVRTGVGGHGVIATIVGDKPGKCIAIKSMRRCSTWARRSSAPWPSAGLPTTGDL